MFLSAKTSREDLLGVVYSEPGVFDAFLDAGLDPEHMETSAILAFVGAWIEAGNEATC